MLQIIALVTPLFGLVFLGYLAGRFRKLPIEGLAWLNFFLLYIALPALFFRLLAATPVTVFTNTSFFIHTTSGTFIIFTLCFCIARIVRKTDTRTATIQGFGGAYGNIGYMGPPLCIAAFGPEAGVPVALVFCFDNIMHFTLAPTLMALGDTQRQSAWAVVCNIFKRIFAHPFILATIAGVTAAWLEFEAPKPIDQLLASAANAAAPCALFAMGVTAALRPLARIPVEISYLLPIKLLIHPLLMYALLTRLPDLNPVWLHSAVLMAALPTATNMFVIAQQYQVWEERASSLVVLSTVMSITTLTGYLYMVKMGVI